MDVNKCEFVGKVAGPLNEVLEILDCFNQYYDYRFIDEYKLKHNLNKFYAWSSLDLENCKYNEIKDIFDMYTITEILVRMGEMKNINRKTEMLKYIKKFCAQRLKKYKDSRNYKEIKELYYSKMKDFSKEFKLKSFQKIVQESKNEYLRIPTSKHFMGIKNFVKIESGVYDDGECWVVFSGNVDWSLNSAIGNGFKHSDFNKYQGMGWFKATNLEDLMKKYPKSKIEMYSTEPTEGFGEYIMATSGVYNYQIEDLEVSYFNTIEEAKKAGIDLPEEMTGIPIYTKIPYWFIENEYEFDFEDEYEPIEEEEWYYDEDEYKFNLLDPFVKWKI